ncbi:MAG: DUF3263 domain-containing protein [Actinomycetota bacterium]
MTENGSRPDAALHERWPEILDFEREWWRGSMSKESAIRQRFGISPARYHQFLNRLLDRPEALQHDPMLVRRLRRLREARRRKRFAERLGAEG